MEIQQYITWGITILLGIGGWIFGFIQSSRVNNLQKFIEEKKMKHDAYASFLRELDDISKEMSYAPMNTIKAISQKYISKITSINFHEEGYEAIVNESMKEMFSEMWDCIDHASKPLMRISQAVAAVELDASDELILMLQELKSLTLNFNKEWQEALKTYTKDQNGLQKLSKMGENNQWKRFVELQSEIIKQMRKECSVE